MHIILFVLKIIGIVLLILLGLLLFLLLLCLFVPIRYRMDATKKEETMFHAVARWLFPVLYATCEYQGDKLKYQIYILGICVYPRKEKVKKEHKSSFFQKKKHNKKKGSKNREPEETPDLVTMEIKPDAKEEGSETNRKDSKISEQQKEKLSALNEKKQIAITDKKEKTETVSESKQTHERKQTNDSKQSETSKQVETSKQAEKSKQSEEPKQSVFRKAITLWNMICEKIRGIIDFIQTMSGKRNLILDFLKLEENKMGILTILFSTGHLLKHIAPTKIRGEILFGLGDPCQTGQALGVFGVLFAIYGESLRIVPDFEESVFEGEILIKGRIRVFTLLRICIKLLLDDKFKRLKINFDNLKEAL